MALSPMTTTPSTMLASSDQVSVSVRRDLPRRSEWACLGTTRTLRARDVLPQPRMEIKRYRDERWASYGNRMPHVQPGALLSRRSASRMRGDGLCASEMLDAEALLRESGGDPSDTPQDVVRVIVDSGRNGRGGYRYVDELALGQFESLQMVDASGNTLPFNPFGSLMALQELTLACNSLQLITEIRPSQFPKLLTLDLSYNMLTEASLGELSEIPLLTTLKLKCNGLDAMPRNLQNFMMLTELDLSQNNLHMQQTLSDLLAMKRMRTLDLSDNKFAEVPALGLGRSASKAASAGAGASVPTPRASSVVQSLRLERNRFETFHSTKKLVALTLLDTVTLWGNPLCFGKRRERDAVLDAMDSGVFSFNCLLDEPAGSAAAAGGGGGVTSNAEELGATSSAEVNATIGAVPMRAPERITSFRTIQQRANKSRASAAARAKYAGEVQLNLDSWSAVADAAQKTARGGGMEGWESPGAEARRLKAEAAAAHAVGDDWSDAGFFMTAEQEWKKPLPEGRSKTHGMGLMSEEQIRRNFFAECKQLLPGALPSGLKPPSPQGSRGQSGVAAPRGRPGTYQEMSSSKLKATHNHMRHCLKFPLTSHDPSVPIASFGLPTKASRRKHGARGSGRVRERGGGSSSAIGVDSGGGWGRDGALAKEPQRKPHTLRPAEFERLADALDRTVQLVKQ